MGMLRKIGPRKRGIMVISRKMIRLGYFHFTINRNSKLNKIRNNMRYIIFTNFYADLEEDVIFGYERAHTIEVIMVNI